MMHHYQNHTTAHYKDDGPWSMSDPAWDDLTNCPELYRGRKLRHKVLRRFRDEYEPEGSLPGIPAYLATNTGPVKGKVIMTSTGPEFIRY